MTLNISQNPQSIKLVFSHKDGLNYHILLVFNLLNQMPRIHELAYRIQEYSYSLRANSGCSHYKRQRSLSSSSSSSVVMVVINFENVSGVSVYVRFAAFVHVRGADPPFLLVV